MTSRHGPSLLLLATHAPGSTGIAPSADTAAREANLVRYEALLAATPQVVCRVTQQGEIFTLVGHVEDVGGGLRDPGRSVLSWEERIHPADHARFDQEWAAAARDVVPLDTVVRAQRADTTASYRHVRIQAVPLLRDGAVTEWIVAVADAEEQWRLRTRDRLLERASGAASARDLREAYAAVAGAVVPDLADAFLVFQLRHPDLARAGDETPYATRPQTTVVPGVPHPPPVGEDFALGALAKEAIDTGQTRLIVFPPGEPPRDRVSPPTADWMVQAKATSLVLIPVVIDKRTVALVAGASCLGNPPLGESELSVLEEILRAIQDPLRRNLELQSIRNTALVLQRSFLITPPRIDGGRIAAVYRPTSTTAEIGGDWYDATILPDEALALSIGDVIGHDLDAATEMTKASSMLRAFAYTHGAAGPAHTLGQLDQVMQGVSGVALITVVHAVLRPRGPDRCWDVTLSNAGHPPPLLVPAAGPARFLYGPHSSDPPLCVAPRVERHDWHHTLHNGETIVLYTDGLVETPGADISDGLRQLAVRATNLRHQGLSLSRFVTGLLAPAGEAGDDIAIIAFHARDDSAQRQIHRAAGTGRPPPLRYATTSPDWRAAATGEPVAALIRPGNAGSNTATDHITATQLALTQLPKKYRRGRRTLIRTDSAGGTHDFVAWLARRGRWLSYSVGMMVTEQIHQHVLKVPASVWTPAVETGGEVRDGAWVADLTGDVQGGWPQGMRLIVRKERPHPGPQLRLTDADGMRLTCFATNPAGRPIAELELRYRLRARAEDRIRNARATGLRNLPLHRTAQNRIWLEIVQIALDLLAWMPMLALTGKARLWEPRRLRLRLFTAAGQLVTTGRRRILRLARH